MSQNLLKTITEFRIRMKKSSKNFTKMRSRWLRANSHLKWQTPKNKNRRTLWCKRLCRRCNSMKISWICNNNRFRHTKKGSTRRRINLWKSIRHQAYLRSCRSFQSHHKWKLKKNNLTKAKCWRSWVIIYFRCSRSSKTK